MYLILGDIATFFCGHVYHDCCVFKRGGVRKRKERSGEGGGVVDVRQEEG